VVFMRKTTMMIVIMMDIKITSRRLILMLMTLLLMRTKERERNMNKNVRKRFESGLNV